MKPVKILVLGVAALAAVMLAVLVRGMVSGKATSQAAAAAVPIVKARPMARVLVARRDLKIGERMAAEDLDWQDWPIEAVNPAFTTDGSFATPGAHKAEAQSKPDDRSRPKTQVSGTRIGRLSGATGAPDAVARVTHTVAMLGDGGPKSQFLGAVVRQPFLKGEPIVASKVVRAGDSGYLAVILPAGMRAMAVPVKVETAAGGFILPGDRVDVILSRQLPADNGHGSRYLSATVLTNIKVLAVDQVAQAEKDETTVVGATATLQVSATDSEALALAKAEGDLSLTLRSYADVDQPSGHTGAATGRSSQIAEQSAGVRVFRNGEAVEVQVHP